MHAAASQRIFIGASAVLLVASTALTIVWCSAMSTMHGMPMPGGWTMSMMWMRMPGQSWPGVAAAFLAMWLVMMAAMMLPVLLPMLGRYREAAVRGRAVRLDMLTAIVAGAYFAVWLLFGAIVFVVGMLLASLEMRYPTLARAVPMATGAIVLCSGALQFTAWKAHHLACCRGTHECCRTTMATMPAAWRHGVRLGLHCAHCCCGLTLSLLVVGMMDLRAMAAVTAAICIERLAPGGVLAARAIGLATVATGAFLVVRALG